MQISTFIIENRELFKLFYTIAIVLICALIVVKTDRLFRLSFHQGIRYFRNAFFFYGFAFAIRYILGLIYFFSGHGSIYSILMRICFEYFLIMAGFFLFYSLLWKRFETHSFSSLLNPRIFVFYVLTLVLVLLDYLWGTYNFMYLSQIILFSYVAIISYLKYRENPGKSGFLKLYIAVILLNLLAWVTNFIVATFFAWHQTGMITVYAMNLVIFSLFLYAVVGAIKK